VQSIYRWVGMNGQMKHINAITVYVVPRSTAMTTAAAVAAAVRGVAVSI